jgi:DNA-binding FadR family transcriptional regulator
MLDVVELGLVRQAVRKVTDAFLAELTDALGENRACRDDLAAFIKLDIRFHYVIAKFAGDQAIMAILEAMAGWLSNQRQVTLQVDGGVDFAIAHHTAIFEAVSARDPDAAETAMQNHRSRPLD